MYEKLTVSPSFAYPVSLTPEPSVASIADLVLVTSMDSIELSKAPSVMLNVDSRRDCCTEPLPVDKL